MSSLSRSQDQVPLVAAGNMTSISTPVTPTPQSTPSASTFTPPKINESKNMTRPKIRGAMAHLLRRRCLVRSLDLTESAVRPKAFLMDDSDDDEDTALLTESSSRTTSSSTTGSSSFDLYDAESDKLLR